MLVKIIPTILRDPVRNKLPSNLVSILKQNDYIINTNIV